MFAKQRVLVVDDDTALATLIRSHLPPADYVVHGAADAKEALRVITESKEPYDIALIDLWIPVGGAKAKSAQPYLGVQLAEQVAQCSPGTKLIAVSLYGDAETTLRNSGRFSGFIAKAELTRNPKASLMAVLMSNQCAAETEHAKAPCPQQPACQLKRSWSWITIAAVAGLAAGMVPVLAVVTPSGLPRICVAVGLCTFIVVLFANPRRRYFRAFSVVLGGWLGVTGVPALGIRVDAPDLLVTFFSDEPSGVFHVVSVCLMITLLILDRFEHRERVEPP